MRARKNRSAHAARRRERSQDPSSQRGRIRVNVNLVSVLVSVLDDKNRPAPDLPKEAFQLFEEGLEQQINKFEAGNFAALWISRS